MSDESLQGDDEHQTDAFSHTNPMKAVEDMERFLGLEETPRPDTSLENAARSAAPSAVMSPPAGYEIVGELGRGGMGVVYRARHVRLQRQVALKMILAGGHASPGELVRFLGEAEAVAGLQHPNIISLLEFGEHQGLPFFTMDYMPGGSLATRLKEGPQTPREAARIIEQLARGIHYAHGRGIVHRDLKPANVLLAEDGTPRITDFGLARRMGVGAGLTGTGDVLGTPSYMAPEQAGGQTREAGPAADVYALGAILYECLTGHPPFRAATSVQTVLLVVNREPVSVTQLQPQTPIDLATICHKCLQKDPHRRYASALELAEDCAAFLEGKPIQARPVGKLERGWRWCRRNPVVATLLALVLFTLVAGTLVATTFAIRAERARKSEQARAETEAKATQEADDARRKEAAARKKAQEQLIDLCAASGLLSVKQNDHAQALLWFGRAVSLAADDPERDRVNRVRYGNWLRNVWRPVRAFSLRDMSSLDFFVAFQLHADGKHLLTLTHKGAGAVWDMDQATSRPLPGDQSSAATWSPDGARIAVVNQAGELEILSFPELKPLQQAKAVKGAKLLNFSPDGRYLAWAGANQVRVWDCEEGAYATPVLRHPQPVFGMRFNPNGLLATGCEDRQARVYVVANTSDQPFFPPVPHWGSTRTQPVPEFINGGKTLMTIAGGNVTCRHALSGKLLRTASVYPAGTELTGVVPHPDGQRVVIVGSYGLRLFDSATGKNLATAESPQLILDASLDPSGEVLVTAGEDRTARFWSLSRDSALQSIFHPVRHPRSLYRSRFLSASLLVTCQDDGQVVAWKTPAEDLIAFRLPIGAASRLAASADGIHAAPSGMSFRSGSLTRTEVFDIRTGKAAGPPLEPGGVITDAAFSPDGDTLATASSTGMNADARDRVMFSPKGGETAIQLWDWRTGTRRGDPIPAPTEPRGLAFSPDSKHLAAACADGWVLLIDPARLKVIHSLDTTVRSRFSTPNLWLANGVVRFSPDGRWLISWEMDTRGSVHVWEVQSGRLCHTFTHVNRVWEAAFDPTSRYLAVADHFQIHFWDLETGKPAAAPLPDVSIWVRFLDADRVITTGGVGSVAQWNWRTGKLLVSHRHFTTTIQDCITTSEGRWMMLASDRLIALLDSRTAAPVAPALVPGPLHLSIHASKDGSRAVTSGFSGTVLGLNLAALTTPAEGNADDLLRLAELHAGARIDDAGSVLWFSPAEWREHWDWYRARHGDLPWPAGK